VKPMRVALLHNVRPEETPPELPDDAFEEYDRPRTVAAITRALEELGVVAEPVHADQRLPWRLDEGHYDFAFNIAEGAGRRCRAAVPAAVCELLGIPITGPDALTLALTLDKAMARRVVFQDVPVPSALLIESSDDERALSELQYPIIVKPNDEGSSKGIWQNALVANPSEAVTRSRWLRSRYGCPVLAEEYLPGKEVTVGIIGNGPKAAVLGIMEIAPTTDVSPFVYSVEVKRDWSRRVRYYIPPRLPADVLSTLEHLSLTAYRLLGCRDCARIDFRLDAEGAPRFIECNSLPGLDPVDSDMVFLAAPASSYTKLVQGILLDAAERYGLRIELVRMEHIG
jgi:D-alanine-D-alanine ligase